MPVLALSLAGAVPAFADGGSGGGGSLGGVDSATSAGGLGGTGTHGGGGGGAGATGGRGGDGGGLGYGLGGAGGASAGAAGADGGNATGPGTTIGGGGGGGGAHGYVGANLPAGVSAITGGAGGTGGSGAAGFGGGGGAGGWGAVITGSGPLNWTAPTLQITGGAGGAGGEGTAGAGFGGTGGLGLSFATAVSSVVLGPNIQILGGTGGTGDLSGSQGGAGGAGLVFAGSGSVATFGGTAIGGAGGLGSTVAAGGAGITGTNLTLTLTAGAHVTGGLDSDGATRANAIAFAGTTNILALQGNGGTSGQTYATITGTVVGSTGPGATNTLKLTGAGGVFNAAMIDGGSGSGQFRNFTAFDVNTTGTWVIENATAPSSPLAVMPLKVTAGTLQVGSSSADGSLLVAATVLSGATLKTDPTGTHQAGLSGGVTVQSGGTLGVTQATSAQNSLVVANGAVTLNAGSILAVTLGAPTATALLSVGGNLTLNGTLNITDSGSMAEGSYLLTSYTGSRSGSGLTIGTAPKEFAFTLNTATSGEIKLQVVDVGLYWNGTTTVSTGAVVGGSGTWTAAASGVSNWTNAAANTALVSDGTKVAIFTGLAGTVTVSDANGPVSVKGMKVITSGYEITGASLTLADGSATPQINVVGTTTTATISSVLAGTYGLEKIGEGTLILTGVNTYTGGTTINAGTLTISNGGSVSGAGSIGKSAGSTGAVTVTGVGSTWKMGSNALTVGFYGPGTLTIADGGSVTTGEGYIGEQPGSSGTATVTGASSTWKLGSTLYVGFYGSGALTIADGGTLTSGEGYIGYGTGSTGTVTVTGTGSKWTLGTNDLAVGLYGSGTLTIADGGTVTSGGGYIGLGTGSSNMATVTGTGSAWKLGTNSLNVGYNSNSGTLNIEAGGTVTSGAGYIGFDSGSSGVATVTGSGSTWNLGTYVFYVASSGNGTLTIADGGTVTSGRGIIGYRAGSSGTVTVTGTGSTWALGTNTLTIGSSGSGTLTVADGGTVVAGRILKGANAQGGTLALNGGTLKAGSDQSDFLSGFSSGNIILGTAGGILDTNGHAVGISAVLSGPGALTKAGTGTLTLSGANTYSGPTTVSAGTLALTGAVVGAVNVESGATLTGTGSAAGTLSLKNGATFAGTSSSTFTVGGDLVQQDGSVFNLKLLAPTTTAVLGVTGDLTLGGTLNLTAGAGFVSGTYRLIDYGGSLTGNTLAIGTAPSHSLYRVDTTTDHQVDLVVAAGQWWNGATTSADGTVHGGTGTWNVAAAIPNWTNETATASDAWGQGGLAIFAGTAGTVTVSGATAPQVAGLEFLTDGYTVTGGSITLSTFFAGTAPNVSTGTGVTTIIASVLTGTDGLTKIGDGTLILTGTSSYTGGTTITAGTLSIAAGGSVTSQHGTIGDITGSSGTAMVTGTGSTWTLATYPLTVGSSGSGTLTIADGGSVTSGTGTIGANAGSTGAGTVTGTGSTWNLGSTLYVGSSGSGTLSIMEGGSVTSGDGYIGFDTGSTGTATVTGTGSTWTLGTNALTIGSSGSGTLSIMDGGSVTSGDGYIGFDTGSTGTATVTGTGSKWTLGTNALTIGSSGSGTLGIADGGSVTSGEGYIGEQPGSSGTASVTGVGSTWTLGSTLYVGFYGSGTLTITDGGSVTSGDGYIGFDTGSTGTVTVTGTGSTWTLGTNDLAVGLYGSGTLTIADGGTVTSGGGYIGLGTGSGNTATVTGTGSTWNLGNYSLNVGYNSNSGTLTIEAGGTVTSGSGYIGFDTGSSGTVTVTGTGSTWALGTNTLTVGSSGTGTLTVADGGTVIAAQILKEASAQGGTLALNGGTLKAGSDQSDFLSGFSSGDIVLGTNGGILDTNGHAVGISAILGGSGGLTKAGTGTLTLSGANSFTGLTTVSAGTLALTGSVNGALSVEAGATLTGTGSAAGALTLKDGAAFAGTSGSTFTVGGALTLGSTSALNLTLLAPTTTPVLGVTGGVTLGGTLNLTAGAGFVSGTYRLIDYGGSLTGNTLAIGTAPSHSLYRLDTTTDHQVNLVIAAGQWWNGATGSADGTVHGGTGTWNVAAAIPNWTNEAGSTATAWGQGGIAIFAGTAGTVTVSGATAPQVVGLEFLTDGYTVTGGSLVLTAFSAGTAPTVSTDTGVTATIASALTGTDGLTKTGDGTLILTGTSSYTGDTTISAGTLSIAAGGSVTSQSGTIGDITGSSGTAMVTGTGSTWTLGTYALTVGSSGSGTLTIADGGTVTSGSGYIGFDTGSSGTATVTGTGSTWALGTNALTVGSSGSGTLTVADGGTVTSGTGTIGANAGSTGAATVTGTDSTWNLGTANLTVGASGSGTLTISDGGTVTSAGGYLGFNPGSTGTATVTGTGSTWDLGTNTLFVGNTGTGALTVADGGTVIAGQISKGGGAPGGTLTLDGGTLKVATDQANFLSFFSTGAITLAAGGGTVDTDGHDVGIARALSGSGGLTKAGTGTLTLTGANTYTGTTMVSAGTLSIGDGNTAGAVAGAIVNDAALIFNRSDNVTAAGTITGTGTLEKLGAGTLTLTGANSAATTTVSAGTLDIQGGVSLASDVTVASGATLKGATDGTSGGSITGTVTIADGGTLLVAPTSSADLYGLSISTLVMSDASNLNVVLGSATGTGTLQVGALTLDGILNVTDAGSMVLGVYRIIDYTTLTADNGLRLGTTPTQYHYAIDVIPNQVNLTVVEGTLGYWNGSATTPGDGTIQGGMGTWTADAAHTNWLSSQRNQSMAWNGMYAVFTGTADTVTVDTSAGAVATTGMQFMVDGYEVTGDTLTLAAPSGQTQVRVGDGTAAGASMVATISAPLAGTTGLEKTDLGTLILTGANAYTGGTTVTAGTLQIGNGGTAGSIGGDVAVATDATFAFKRSDAVLFAGTISGGGALVQEGSGTLTLTGTNTYTGGTTISLGTLQIGDGGTAGSIIGNVENNTALVFNRSDDLSYDGVISGTGTLEKQGAGTLTLAGTNTFSGATTVSAGTLALAGGSSLSDTARLTVALGAALELTDTSETIGSLAGAGAVTLNAYCLTTGGDGTSSTFSGAISGTGCVIKTGTGTLTLTGTSGFTGGLTIADGAVVAGAAGAVGTGTLVLKGAGTFQATDTFTLTNTISLTAVAGMGGGTFEVAPTKTLTLSGVISGDGELTKTGTGTLVLAGANSFTGPTTVSAGQVNLSGGSALADTARLTVALGASLELTDADETVGSLAGAGAVTLNSYCLTTGGDNSSTSFSGSISGSGGCLAKTGTGTLTLTGTNTYTGQTRVDAGIVVAQGGHALGSGGAVSVASGAQLIVEGAENVGALSGAGTVTLAGPGLTVGSANTDTTFSGTLGGAGGLTKTGSGTLTLSGTSSYSGDTHVSGGILAVTGGLTDSDVYVHDLATLSGTGSIARTVHVLSGGTLAGSWPTGLTMGALDMQAGATMAVSLGGASANPVFNVTGDVTLAGTLAVTQQPGFGLGIYRVVNYAGTLTGDGMSVSGLAPDYVGGIQTSVAGQVNLIVEDPNNPTLFWNGSTTSPAQTIVGGTGTWVGGITNWTNASGTAAQPWNTGFAVFQGAAGTVTVSDGNGPVSAIGMQFVTTGYVVTGDGITLNGIEGGPSVLRVGDGTVESASTVATIASVLSGTSGVEKGDHGTLILTGANLYTGGTTVTGGVLQLGNGGASGAILGDVALASGTALAFNRSDAASFSGVISGAGQVVQMGTGTLTLSGANSYSGGTAISAGTLEIASAGNLGSGALALSGAGTLKASGTFALAQAVSLTAVAGAGGGTLEVDGESLTLSGVVSGDGALTKTGAGTLVLTGTNTYTSGTTISAGTLQLGNGGTTGSILGDVVNTATLVFNRSDSFAFTGAITGSGEVVITGGGTLTFSAPDTGPVTLNGANAILVESTVSASPFTVGNGTLGGTGTIGALTLNAGGVVSPGYSPGTLTISGPVTFNAGSVYRVDVTPDGTHDLIVATGAVTLSNGAQVQVAAVPGRYPASQQVAILTTSGTLTGTFGSVTSDYAFLAPELSYDAHNVYLFLAYTGTQFVDYARTPNEANAAVAAQPLGPGNPVFEALMGLPAGAVAPALDQLTGEAYVSAGTVMMDQALYLREAVGARLRQGMPQGAQGSALSYAAKAAGPATALFSADWTPTLWMQGYGGWGNGFSNGNAATVSSTIGGFFAGLDAMIADQVRVGVVGGFSQSHYDVTDRNSSGSIDNYDVGLYAGGRVGSIDLKGAVSYTWHDLSASRSIVFPGFMGATSAGYTQGTTQVFGEMSMQVRLGAYEFEPFLGLAYVNLSSGSGMESVRTPAALAVNVEGMDTVYTTLGARVATTVEVGGRSLTPSATLGWQHAFGDTAPVSTMRFVGGSVPFTIEGVPIAQDAAIVGAGLSYALSDRASLQVNYLGQIAAAAANTAFSAQFAVKF